MTAAIKRVLYAGIGVLLLLGAYAAAGFWGVPRLVHRAVVDHFATVPGRAAALGEVRFNPFTFRLEARQFALPDADGTAMLSFERLLVDFELASLWRGAWSFREIALERPYIHLVQRSNGALNLGDLAGPSQAGAKPTATGGALPRLQIDDLSLSDGEVDVTDRNRPREYTTRLAPLHFRLQQFSTTADGNAFELAATGEGGGSLRWKGTLGVAPVASSGSVELEGLQADLLWDYLADALPFRASGGKLGVRTDYRLALEGEPLQLALGVQALTLDGVAIAAAGREEAWVTVPSVAVGPTNVDATRRSVEVGPVTIAGLTANAWREPDGRMNLLELLGSAQPAAAAPADALPTDAAGPAAAAADQPWQLSVASVALEGARVEFEDRGHSPATRLVIAPLDFRVEGYALGAKGPLPLQARAVLESGGSTSVQGALTLDPLGGEFDVTVDALALAPLAPYLTSGTDLELRAGTVSTSGRLDYRDRGSEAPALRYRGEASLAQLRTLDRALAEDFFNVRQLAVEGLELTTAPFSLVSRRVVAREPYFRFIIASTGVTNVQSVLDPEGAAAAIAAAETERAAADERKRTRTRKGTSRKQSRRSQPAIEQPAPPPPKAIPARIDRVEIVNGTADFADYTLRPNFATGVQRLGGTIVGLSGDPRARAEVKLDGQVDRFSPVTIRGQVNYFAAQSYTDLQATFRNMELTTFSPYSGKFAGYEVQKGKLSVELNYLIEQRKLDARHKVVINQLELGRKVDSPDATRLPVRLAVALLKDRNGVIDLDLPISGTLDDPTFRLGPLIWKVVVNLLTKAATAPFALIGSLFGGGPDLAQIDFAPGSAALDAAAQAKVETLRKALVERPGLSLDIPQAGLAELDRAALYDARWRAELEAALVRGDGGRKVKATTLDAMLADRAQYLALLEGMERRATGAAPKVSKPPKPASGEPPVDKVEHGIAELEPRTRARVVVTADDLSALARRRAESVQSALLVDTGIAPDRVFVIQGMAPPAGLPTVRMELTLR